MRDKTVGDCMTPVESVFMLDVDGVIDQAAMNEVLLCLASSLSCYYIRSADQWVVYTTLTPWFPALVGLVWHVDSLSYS